MTKKPKPTPTEPLPKPDPSLILKGSSRSGGVDLNAGRDVTIGGDVVGRDKIINIQIQVELMMQDLSNAVGPNHPVVNEVRKSIQLIMAEYVRLSTCKDLHNQLQELITYSQVPYQIVMSKFQPDILAMTESPTVRESLTEQESLYMRERLDDLKQRVDRLQRFIDTDDFLGSRESIKTWRRYLVRAHEDLTDSKRTLTVRQFVNQGREFNRVCFDFLNLADKLLHEKTMELSQVVDIVSVQVIKYEPPT